MFISDINDNVKLNFLNTLFNIIQDNVRTCNPKGESSVVVEGESMWGDQKVLHLDYCGRKYRLSLQEKSKDSSDYESGFDRYPRVQHMDDGASILAWDPSKF